MRLVRALRPSRLATYALLTAALIYFSLPFYLMVVNGLRPFRDFSPLDIWSVWLSGRGSGRVLDYLRKSGPGRPSHTQPTGVCIVPWLLREPSTTGSPRLRRLVWRFEARRARVSR